jgi:hypothetical protein
MFLGLSKKAGNFPCWEADQLDVVEDSTLVVWLKISPT